MYNYIQRIDIQVGQGNPCKHSCCASPFNYFYFIHKWLANILELDFFNIIMKKYKPWSATSSPEFFASNL